MRKLFYYSSRVIHIRSLLCVVLFMTASVAYGQLSSSKTITKLFAMTDDGQVIIGNKYGSIEMRGWNIDSVKVQIEIVTQGESDELIKRIKPTFDDAEEFLKVNAVIEPKRQGYFNRLFRDINPIEFNKGDIDINYVVYLPTGAQMKITNKFGDVIIEGCQGRLRANIEHGDLRISDNIGQLEANVEFGMIRAHKLSTAELQLKNGSVDISSAEHIQLNSAGSDIEIDSIGTLRVMSGKDKIIIGSVGTISGELRFSEIRIQEVIDFCDVKIHQTDMKINALSSSSPTVHLEQSSSEVELVGVNTGMQIEAHMESGLLRLPKHAHNLDVTVLDEKDEIREISASLGTAPFAKINITGKKGYILIK